MEAERALTASEERFRGIVETTEEWIWESDAQLRTTYNNPAAERITGYAPDELNNFTPATLVYEPDREKLEEVVRKAVQSGSRWKR